MSMSIIRAGLLMMWAIFVVSCTGREETYVLEAGLVGFTEVDGQPVAHLVEKTDRISRRVGALEGMGFRIASPRERPFIVHTEHFLPGIPEKIGQDTFEGYSPEDAMSGMKTKPVEVTGQRYFFWGFDPTDPLGPYRIRVYVDGALLEELEFIITE